VETYGQWPIDPFCSGFAIAYAVELGRTLVEDADQVEIWDVGRLVGRVPV
jgi:hypothetical protein